MSYYNVGATAPTGGLDALRRQAKEVAMSAQKKYIGVAFGKDGQEMAASDTEAGVMDWYGLIVDRKDVYYAIVFEGRDTAEEYIGEIPVSTKPPRSILPWVAGAGAGLVGVVALFGRKRRS